MSIVGEATRRATGIAGGAVRGAAWAAGQGLGALQRLGGAGGEHDDQALARKVETVIFGDAGAAKIDKAGIDVNAVDGAVWLRGVAPNAAAISALEAAARAIPEVTEVHNLLHLPKTPAPTRPARRPARPGSKVT